MKDKTLDSLETILVWEGEIDNPRIRELLDVGSVWASRLLGELMQRMGARAIRASAHAPLRHVGTKIFGTPDDYLRIAGASTIIEDARMDISVVPPSVFSSIIQAIRKSEGLRLLYRSMTHPIGTERIVYPHAIIRVSRRWHMRAWCETRQEFRDFTLGRIASIKRHTQASPKSRVDDKEWNEEVNITIVAHPRLSTEQQEMIRAEYFVNALARRLVIRRCLTDYILRDLHIAVDPERQLPPEYQLALAK